MERRTRSKIQELGLEAEVEALLARGLTYEDIAAHIAETTGHAIGKSSVARYNGRVQRQLSAVRAMKESANALTTVLGDRDGEQPDTRVPDMLLNLIQATLMSKLADEDISTKDAVGLAFAGSQAVKAQETIERLRRTERERTRKAWEKVMQEARTLLEKSGLWPDVERVLQAGMRAAVGND